MVEKIRNLHCTKGNCQKRFSGFCPLRGYPPPTPLTENQCEKKKDFFLSGQGGYPSPPSRAKSAKTFLTASLRDTGTLCLGRIQSAHHHHQSLLLKRSQDNEGLKIIEAKSQFWSLVLFLGPGSLSRSWIPVLDCDLDLDYDS